MKFYCKFFSKHKRLASYPSFSSTSSAVLLQATSRSVAAMDQCSS